MAAKDNISKHQFVRLYRGINQIAPEHLEQNPSEIGPHWTPNLDVAYNFATNRDFSGYPMHDWNDYADDPVPLSGTVVEALVHKRNIIDPESEEGQGWQMGSAVFGREHPEGERTVRPGSPVHVQAFHEFDDDKETYRNVKPLRRKGYRA